MTTAQDIGENSDLALLTLRTALEIDRKLLGKQADASVFESLGAELSRVSGVGEPQSTALYEDPVTTEIFLAALGAYELRKPSDIDELKTAIAEIVERLRDRELKLDDFSELKKFCLAFHRSLMAQQLSGDPEDEYQFGEIGEL